MREAALEKGYAFKGRKKSEADDEERVRGRLRRKHGFDNEEMLDPELQLLAGTSFVFAREEIDEHLDTLFMDEAGQVALADAIAVGTAARNIVLLGDPNQLSQVSQGAHPPGAERVGSTAPARRRRDAARGNGPVLEETWRMRPEVNEFIPRRSTRAGSDRAGACSKRSLAAGNGIRYVAVEHEGNRKQSAEEAEPCESRSSD